VRLRTGDAGLVDVVRALDSAGVKVETLELHQPTLDDVFLAKTGRSLEGAGDDEEDAGDARLAVEAA
jgi:ABC-2 type transport system ATP-binding protein